jgi:hypothetical protein
MIPNSSKLGAYEVVAQIGAAGNGEKEGKVAEALQEVARAIDRLAEAVRSLRNQPGATSQ